jgi:predicted cobalt transporter CbtA
LRNDFTTTPRGARADEFWNGEWDDAQIRVATEAALQAAVDLIIFQREAWNDLVDAVTDVGVHVHISPAAQTEHDEILGRMKAALDVAKEVVSITPQDLKDVL